MIVVANFRLPNRYSKDNSRAPSYSRDITVVYHKSTSIGGPNAVAIEPRERQSSCYHEFCYERDTSKERDWICVEILGEARFQFGHRHPVLFYYIKQHRLTNCNSAKWSISYIKCYAI